jgi:hypothetical protein
VWPTAETRSISRLVNSRIVAGHTTIKGAIK